MPLEKNKNQNGNSIHADADGKDSVTNEIKKLNLQTDEKSSDSKVKLVEKDDYVDPFCNADTPHQITFQDVSSAAFKIRSGVVKTPCPRSKLSEQHDMDLYLKMDFLQYTGSFKERGARYMLQTLTEEQQKVGVISASLGNHAQAISYHGYKLNIPVTVVMPEAAPIMKIQKCRNFKARVIVYGKDMGEAKSMAMQMSEKEGLLYVNGYDHPHIMAGQGTIGLEILEQVPEPDAVVVPVGGGGLIAGIATAIKTLSPKTKIIGVESEKCASFTRAMENGGPIHTPIHNTLADGLAVPKVGYNAFVTAMPLIDKMIVVKEEWIALGILHLVEQEKCVVEGAGAAGLAAILSGHLMEFKKKKVVLLLCGGNIDTTVFGRCLERGLAAEGRLVKFNVSISDRPGGINELCQLLANLKVCIKDIMHERAWLKDVYTVEVKVICETTDWGHSLELKDALKNRYDTVQFTEEPMAIRM